MDWNREPAKRFDEADASFDVWFPAPRILVTRASGRGTPAVTRFYIGVAREALERFGRIQVFHDWSRVSGYDPEARDLIRAFGKTNSDETVLVHYLVGSKILSMAIQTAGLVLGREFASTTDERTFGRWLTEAISRARVAGLPIAQVTKRPSRE